MLKHKPELQATNSSHTAACLLLRVTSLQILDAASQSIHFIHIIFECPATFSCRHLGPQAMHLACLLTAVHQAIPFIVNVFR